MKTILLLLFIYIITLSAAGQNVNPEYDSVLAKSLGADDLGMKMYVLVILQTGAADIRDTAIRAQLFRGHFANITRLSEQGKMITAGPLDNNDLNFRGIFVLDVTDIEEARQLMKGDPTIEQKIFEPLYFLWYGSAAFPEISKIHRRIQKMALP